MGESFDIDSGRESSAGKQLITALLDFACTDTSGSKSIDSRVSSLTLHSMVKAPVGNSNSQFTPQILKQKQHFIVMKITFPQPPPVIPPSTSHTHTHRYFWGVTVQCVLRVILSVVFVTSSTKRTGVEIMSVVLRVPLFSEFSVICSINYSTAAQHSYKI